MEMLSLVNELKENTYPGRGIVLGKSRRENEKKGSGCILYYGKK